jgi:hypothetical protein
VHKDVINLFALRFWICFVTAARKKHESVPLTNAYVQRSLASDVIADSFTVLKCGKRLGEFSETPVLVSKDLSSFQHLHMEDYYPLTADALRAATFHFPVTLPYAGEYRLVFDYAHENQWLQTDDWMTVDGDVPQLDAPVEDWSTTQVVDGMQIELVWDNNPVATYEAQWHIHITQDGADVTDLVQYLGADAHALLITEDASWAAHTHAWVPGLETMSPDMSMGHLYPGPDLPFHFTFPAPGNYKAFIQFARAADPDTAFVVPFWIEVSP